MNKMRIGTDGTKRAQRDEKVKGTIWRESLVRKMGEDGVSSFESRLTQYIFGHHDRTRAVLCDRSCARRIVCDELGWHAVAKCGP